MFEYFQNIYPWNLAIVTALDMGAVASDVDLACRPLRKFAGPDAPGASAAWAENWSTLGDRLKRQATRDEADGHSRSAGHKALRGICVEAVRTSGNNFTMTKTGKNGLYTTGRVPAGRYAVVFFPGCGNNGNWLAQVYKNNKLAAVRVRAGKTTTGVNAVLRLGGEISGTVTNTSGKKLSNICGMARSRWPLKFFNAAPLDSLMTM